MSLQDRWKAPAGAAPGTGAGGAAVLVIGLAAVLVRAPKDERPPEQRRRLITNLLTDADPRALGIEGLAERLRRVETHIGQLTAGLDQLGHAGKSGRDADLDRLHKEQVLELQRLQASRTHCAPRSTA